MAANESTNFTNFSNVKIGTASGGGRLFLAGTEVTSTAAELNALDGVTEPLVTANKAETLAAADTLVAADSGKVFYLNAAAGATVTLPAVTTTGWRAKFVVAAAFATTPWVIASAEGDNISGIIMDMGVTVAGVPAAAEDFINFVESAETIGDWIEIYSDGTSWHVTGACAANGGITATDPA